jgi:DNA modification methylase
MDDAAPPVHPNNRLNQLAGNEWLYFTKSVLQTSYPAAYGHDLRRQHGANKPPQLMAHIIEFFTKPGGTVLDPFAGVGGTLIGATTVGRVATGIELNPRWVEVYRQVCRREGLAEQETIIGDCLEVLQRLLAAGCQYDLIATDPPYSIALAKTLSGDRYAAEFSNRRTDFDTFGDDPRDFRNLETFEQYYEAMGQMAEKAYPLLRRGGYLVLIIRDSYQNGEYVMASYEISQRVRAAGFVMKGIKIWYGTGARVRPYGYPYAYVPNIIHQNLLIFQR